MSAKQKIGLVIALVAVSSLLVSGGASAQIVHLSNVIIDGSLCLGTDCVSGEAFGFITEKLKENNLRITAVDTSNSASFPTGDWQIEFNSSSNGGGSYFMVRDCGNTATTGSTCGGTPQLTIEAGADNNSIYVESSGSQGGNVGFGTSNPAVDLHVLSGNTPTLRLEQDGSSGFTPQSWDVAGNEAGFFIRDVTNGSTLPFRIEPGASSSTIHIENDDDVGIGTSNPGAKLHVVTSGSAIAEPFAGTSMILQNTGAASNPAFFSIVAGNASNSQMAFGDTDDPFAGQLIYQHGTDSYQFRIGGTTHMTLSSAGLTTSTAGGACNPGPCDGTFAPDYEVEPIEEHAAYMWDNQHLWGVGPTPDDEAINLTKTTAGMLHELEKAHIYIEQLHNQLKDVQVELAELKAAVGK